LVGLSAVQRIGILLGWSKRLVFSTSLPKTPLKKMLKSKRRHETSMPSEAIQSGFGSPMMHMSFSSTVSNPSPS
jgi:hypothetical protein